MFGYLSSSALRAKALELIDGFAQDCQPSGRPASRQVPEQVAGRALDRLCAATAAYCLDKRLGVFGRARLARALQDEMKRRGYAPDLVGKLTSAVTANALAAPGRSDGKA